MPVPKPDGYDEDEEENEPSSSRHFDLSAQESRRRVIEAKIEFYSRGPGWLAAYEEACSLIKSGENIGDAAASVGWKEEDLKSAIRRKGKPPKPSKEVVVVQIRERARRTVKQRVDGLKNVTKKMLKLAKHYYEIEGMTVREVARTLEAPYEKIYLILHLANTKFRRPGRRGVDS